MSFPGRSSGVPRCSPDLEGMSFEQFVALAVAEKLSALESVELLRREVAGAKREDFDKYLAAVPDVPPDENDRLD